MKIEEIQGLINFIAKSGLEEVHIKTEQIKLRVKKNAPQLQQPLQELPISTMATMPAPTAQPAPASEEATHTAHQTIKSPMIGTFYQAPNPEAPPFVKVGDVIQQGQKIGVIEAMKLFNELEADMAGTIVKILVEDASPVEYDQPLFLIDPA